MQMPDRYQKIKEEHPKFIEALEQLGKAARAEGPINEKTGHLIQLAAAAAIRSEGSVHSHAKRALAAGASYQEIQHAIILTTSITGFPTTAAALSWIDDVCEKK
ncbi:carboxymuconolactone decarboxylase domain protein [Candidatus Magnetoovum chiemensis]|nr:carboxymuconolactone decarboxylase domain protein [Candidatus Magnetoovum chiemensis]